MDKISTLTAAGIDYISAIRRFGNKEELYYKYLFRFPDEKMFAAGTAAYEAKDYTTAATEIHTLKGVAANLSLIELASLCQEFLVAVRAGDYALATTVMIRLEASYNSACNAIYTVKNA